MKNIFIGLLKSSITLFICINSYASVSTETSLSKRFDSIVVNKLDGTGKCRAKLSIELNQEILNYGNISFDISKNAENIPSCSSNSDEVVLLPALIFGCIGGASIQAFMHRVTEDSPISEKAIQSFGGVLGVYLGNALTPDIADDLYKASKIGRNLSVLSGVALAGVSGIVCAEIVDALI